jgi:hypothetical protein
MHYCNGPVNAVCSPSTYWGSEGGLVVIERRRAAWAIGTAMLLACGIGFALSGAASATTGTATVSPSSNVSAGATVSVSGSGILSAADSQPFTGLIALSQCGNADSSGAALTSISTADCDGAAQVGHIVFATVTSGTLPATSFTIRQSGIGNSNRSCVPVPPATLPCQIGMGDVATSGTNVALAATYTLVVVPVTTTTSSVTTTTTTTTTTAPPTTTTRATSPPPTTASGGTGAQVAAGTVEVIPAPTTTVPGRTLAMTGLGTAGWWSLGIGLALLDLGYLTLSSTRAKRRGLFGRPR